MTIAMIAAPAKRPDARRARTGLTCLLVVAVATSACSGSAAGGRQAGAGSAPSIANSSPVRGANTARGSGLDPASTGGHPRSSPATSPAGPTASARTREQSRPNTATQGGTYSYTEVLDSWQEGAPTITGARSKYRLVVEPRRGNSQRLLEYEYGSPNAAFEDLGWTRDTLLTVSQGVDSHTTCAYQPPLVRLSLPLKDGTTWQSPTRCGGDSVQYQGQVVSHALRDVSGYGQLTVWRITVNAVITVSGLQGLNKVTLSQDEYFAASLVAPIKDTQTTRGYDGSKQTQYKRVIRTLDSSH